MLRLKEAHPGRTILTCVFCILALPAPTAVELPRGPAPTSSKGCETSVATVHLRASAESDAKATRLVSELFDSDLLRSACMAVAPSRTQGSRLHRAIQSSLTIVSSSHQGVSLSVKNVQQEKLSAIVSRLIEEKRNAFRNQMSERKKLSLMRSIIGHVSQTKDATLNQNQLLQKRRLTDSIALCSSRIVATAEEEIGTEAKLKSLKSQFRSLQETAITNKVQMRSPHFDSTLEHLLSLKRERAQLATKYVEGSVWLIRMDERIVAAKNELDALPEMIRARLSVQTGEIHAALQLDIVRAQAHLDDSIARRSFQINQLEIMMSEWRALMRVMYSSTPEGDDIVNLLRQFDEIKSSEATFPISLSTNL